MSFTNAVRILQDMQEFLYNIRGHMESSHSSDSEHTGEEYSSAVPSRTTIAVKKANVQMQEVLVENIENFTLNRVELRSPIVDAVLAIVRCTVCLEVPRAHTYQCARGHLVCEMCLCYLINNARKIGETAQCPTCRGVIRKESSWRNNAIEDVAGELPSECKHCLKEFKIKYLSIHEEKYCPLRLVNCRFKNFGCNWTGKFENQAEHHNICLVGKLSISTAIENIEESKKIEKKRFDLLTDLLCGVGVEHVDLELRPYVTVDDVKKILYDSPTFKAFNTFWCLCAKIEFQNSESSQTKVIYQLLWKTPRPGAFYVHFVILRGPYSDAAIKLDVQSHRFTEDHPRTELIDFPFVTELEYVKQISNSSIPFRLLMSWDH